MSTKIQFLKPAGEYNRGQIAILADGAAQHLIESGYAVAL